MPELRKRGRFQHNEHFIQNDGLYIHANPPKPLQITSAYVKQLIRNGDIEKLYNLVLEGQGKRLIGGYSADYKVRMFLKSVPNIMSKIDLLHDAVNSDRLEELQAILDEEPDRKRLVLAKNEAGVGLLHKAVYYNLKDIAKWLIENYPQTATLKDAEGRTPYHYTPLCRDKNEIPRLLITAGADSTALDNKQHSAKYYTDHVSDLELPSIHKQSPRRYTPVKDGAVIKKSNIRIWIHQRDLAHLQQVVWEGHGAKLLVEHSNNPKVKKFLEAVPHIMGLIKDIHTDVQNDDLESLKTHTSSPIPAIVLSGKDANGLTPLHKAAGLGRESIAEYIIEKYPDSVNLLDSEGRTPLHYATLAKDNGKLFNYILEAGAEESILDNKQKTAAYYRTRSNELDSKILQTVPECPRSAKESFASTFDWNLLTSNAEVNSKVHKTTPPPETNENESESNEKTEDGSQPDELVENGKEPSETEEPEESAHENEENQNESTEDANTENVEAETEVEVKEETQGESQEEALEESQEEAQEETHEEPAEPQDETGEPEAEPALASEDPPEADNPVEEEEPTEPETVQQEGEEPTKAEEDNPSVPEADVDEATEVVENADTLVIELEQEPETLVDQNEIEEAGDNLENQQDDQPNKVNIEEGTDEGEGVIEGIVNGENEIESVNEQGREGDGSDSSDEVEIATLIEEGNMERLAALVLNGEGDRLVGQQSDNPEIQAFLENVSIYMSKINRIHIAARNGNLRDLQAALDRRKFAIAKDTVSPNGCSPLHVAVVFGNTSIVRYLAGRFPETVIAVDDHERTPLHYAAVLDDNGHYFNLLVHLGADVRAEDKFGHTPDYYRSNRDELSHSILLKEFGAEDSADDILNDKALGDPLIKGLTEVANKRPEDPIAYLAQYLYNFANNDKVQGKTEESRAVITGSPQIDNNNAVPTTIDVVTIPPDGESQIEDESAFSITTRDEHGQSMLHFAAARSHGRNALFQLLQETNINVGFRDELYRTARDISIQASIPENTYEIDKYVMFIACKGDTDKLVELLLNGYDHITDIVGEGDVPIVEAVSAKNQNDTVTFLQSILTFEEKRERVHHEIRQGGINEVAALLADEKETGSGKLLAIGKNSYGRCSLHIAVLCQQEEIVDFLVNTFPETLYVGDNLERTALHYAMGVEKMESISKLLIKGGARRVVKDLKGRQPTYYFMNKSDILRLQEEEETF